MKLNKYSLAMALVVLATACSPQVQVKGDAKVTGVDANKTAENQKAAAGAGGTAKVGESVTINTAGDKKEDAPSAAVDAATLKANSIKELLKSVLVSEDMIKFVAETEKKLNARCSIHQAETAAVAGNDNQYDVSQKISCTGLALTEEQLKAEDVKRAAANAGAAVGLSMIPGGGIAAGVINSPAVQKAMAEATADETRIFRIALSGQLDLTAKTISLDYAKADTQYAVVKAADWKAPAAE